MKRNFLIFSLIAILVLIFTGCSSPGSTTAAQPIKLKWSSPMPGTDAMASEIKWFANELNSRTNGRVSIEFYWSSQLMPQNQEPEGLKNGVFDMMMLSSANYPDTLPLQYIGFLPALFPFRGDDEASWANIFAAGNDYARLPDVQAEAAKINAKVTNWFVVDQYDFMGQLPIMSVNDMKGVQFQGLGGVGTLIGKLGASQTTLTFGEVTDAMSKGLIQMIAHNWNALYSIKMHEVSKYYIKIGLGHTAGMFAIRQQSYDALPNDVKKIYDQLVKELPAQGVKFWAEKKATVWPQIEAKLQVKTFPDAEYAKIVPVAQQMWTDYINKCEAKGIPAKKNFNELQNIFKKYKPDYQPIIIK
jgi:TRAP-type C4-dicarboxylate transport system substrate-binding protein